MSVEEAYQRAMGTLQKWVQKEVNAAKTLAVLRTYSPAHVRSARSFFLHAHQQPLTRQQHT